MSEYILLTGVDGSGKTSFYQQFAKRFSGYEYLSLANQLVQQQRNWRNTNHRLKSYREIFTLQQQQYIDEGKNLIVEIPLSGSANQIKKWTDLAHQFGYHCTLIVIEIASTEAAFQRVVKRVQSGGIGVPKETLEQRFIQQQRLLPQIEGFFDQVEIWNNDETFKRIR